MESGSATVSSPVRMVSLMFSGGSLTLLSPESEGCTGAASPPWLAQSSHHMELRNCKRKRGL